jgi:hypothetical protein
MDFIFSAVYESSEKNSNHKENEQSLVLYGVNNQSRDVTNCFFVGGFLREETFGTVVKGSDHSMHLKTSLN